MPSDLSQHFLLQEGLIFLNHGSFGACPKPVFAEYQNLQRQLEQQPVAFLDVMRNRLTRSAHVREILAAQVGAFADDLVGVNNATAGLNAVARSIQLGPGDEVLSTDHEYAALEKTWKFVTGKTGAKLVIEVVDLPLVSADGFTEKLVAAMTPRTKVLFLSHITSPTALVFPIEGVLAEARRRGIITVVDGAHTPGLIKINLNQLGADFYAGNCHKWMMAPKGSAFLWARREVQPMLEPLVVSHGWAPGEGHPGQKGAFGNSRFIDSFETQGTQDPAAWLSVPAAIEFKQEHDWRDVASKCNSLGCETANDICRIMGTSMLAAPEFCAPQMFSVPLSRCDAKELKRRLLEDYNIEVPVFEWNNRCIIRLSIEGYNDRADAAQLVSALETLRCSNIFPNQAAPPDSQIATMAEDLAHPHR